LFYNSSLNSYCKSLSTRLYRKPCSNLQRWLYSRRYGRRRGMLG